MNDWRGEHLIRAKPVEERPRVHVATRISPLMAQILSVLDEPMTAADVASIVGAQPQSVAKAMRALQKHGSVRLVQKVKARSGGMPAFVWGRA